MKRPFGAPRAYACFGQEWKLRYLSQNHFFMSATTTTMTTVDIANRLVELCRKGDFETAQKELFADDAVSIEPHGTPDFEKEIKGLDAILEKGKKWGEMVQEMHGGEVSEPLMADSSFAVTMSMDMTMKNGQRMNMKELCIYHVKDGKIVSEQFLM
jgi:ketosteroid isomerase-like protein